MPRKILMLLSNEYRPDPRVEKEAEALLDSGHEVTILCWDRGRSRPRSASSGGLRIERVRTGRVVSVGSFLLNSPLFCLRTVLRALGMSVDVVHCHDLDTLPQGVFLSKLKGVPLVYDAHEHYAKMIAGDVPGVISSALEIAERILVKGSSAVVAANAKIAEYLRPFVRKEPVVVMNCVDLEEVPHQSSQGRTGGKATIFYGGSLEPLRYVEEVLKAIMANPACRLRIAGIGRLGSSVKNAARISPDIEFLGYLPHDQLMKEMAASDAILCLLDPSNGNNRIGTPNRLFEAMAIGLPVIASEGTLSGEIVRQTGCGVVMAWSEEEFAKVVNELSDPRARERMGRNGRKAAESEYNWGIMKRRLLDTYSLLS